MYCELIESQLVSLICVRSIESLAGLCLLQICSFYGFPVDQQDLQICVALVNIKIKILYVVFSNIYFTQNGSKWNTHKFTLQIKLFLGIY